MNKYSLLVSVVAGIGVSLAACAVDRATVGTDVAKLTAGDGDGGGCGGDDVSEGSGTDDTVYGGFDSGTQKCTRIPATCLSGWEIYKCPSSVSPYGLEIAERSHGEWRSWAFCQTSDCADEIEWAKQDCASTVGDGGSFDP